MIILFTLLSIIEGQVHALVFTRALLPLDFGSQELHPRHIALLHQHCSPPQQSGTALLNKGGGVIMDEKLAVQKHNMSHLNHLYEYLHHVLTHQHQHARHHLHNQEQLAHQFLVDE